jgi:choline transport protein
MFQAFNFVMLAYNIFLMKRTAWIHDIGFAISLAGCIIIFITCLTRSDTKQSAEFVWTNFINSSGWSSDSIVFLIGLINPNYIYAGLDGPFIQQFTLICPC